MGVCLYPLCKCEIADEQLVFALEPEAASIWCQHIKTEINRDLTTLDISRTGTQYMIVDIGGTKYNKISLTEIEMIRTCFQKNV